MAPPAPPDSNPPGSLTETAGLLARRDGAALRELFARFGPRLNAFLHGRLPAGTRTLLETDDLTQEVWAKALAGLHAFKDQGTGSFWWFLRRIALNHLADTYRRAGVREPAVRLPEDGVEAQPSSEPGPLTNALGAEVIEAFDLALSCVGERERNAVLMRLELDEP